MHSVFADGDRAIVEQRSQAIAADGMCFDKHCCWVTRFADETIVEVRACLDSALVQRLIDRNPG